MGKVRWIWESTVYQVSNDVFLEIIQQPLIALRFHLPRKTNNSMGVIYVAPFLIRSWI